jgi:hypothetical protein
MGGRKAATEPATGVKPRRLKASLAGRRGFKVVSDQIRGTLTYLGNTLCTQSYGGRLFGTPYLRQFRLKFSTGDRTAQCITSQAIRPLKHRL